MRWTVPGLGLAKAAGVPARLRLYLSGPADLQDDRGGLIKLYNTEAQYGGIEVSIKEGALELSEPWRTLLAGRSGPDLEDLRRNWPVKSAQLEADGTVNLHRAADWLTPAVRRRIRTAGLAGAASWRLRFRYEQPASAVLEAFCDATDLGFNLGPVNKAKGVRGVARAVVKVAPAEDGSSRFECVLEDFRLEFASAAVRCAGRALLEPLRRPPARIDALSAEITADMRDLERLSQALLARSGLRLSGSAGLDVRVRYEERSGWSVESAEVGLWPLDWSASGTEGRLEGYLSARRGRIAATGLQFSIGSTAGSATFHFAGGDGKVEGVVGLAFESLDAQEMADLVRQLRASLDKARPRFGALLSAGGPGLGETGGAISLQLFGRCDEGKFILRLPDGGSFAVPLDGLGWQAKISGDIVQADAVGAFEGGAFQASINGSTADGADLRISYTVLECLPTPVSRQIVGRSFPGLGIAGPITLSETFRVPVGFKHFAALVRDLEGQIATGTDPCTATEVTGATAEFGPRPRLLMMAEESGGAAMGPAEPIVSRDGKGTSLAPKEKDGMQIGLMALCLAARLHRTGSSFAAYYLDLLDRYETRYRFYQRLDVTLFDESLQGEEREAARAAGNERKEAVVAWFAVLEEMTPRAAAERLQAALPAAVDLPPVQRVFHAGDGTYIEFEGQWFELRASGTDAVLRYYMEGREREQVVSLNEAFTKLEITG